MHLRAMKIPGRRRTWVVGIILAIICFGASALYLSERPAVLSQGQISALPPAALPQEGQRVLAFSPHADDETIAVGGYITLALRNGADVRIVLVTDCNRHNNGQVRYEEFREATAYMGVSPDNIVFLGLPDGKLNRLDSRVLESKLKEQIDIYRPDIVLYPLSGDMHPDHAAIGRALTDIVKANPSAFMPYEYLVHFKLFYPEPYKYDPSLELLPPKKLVTGDVKWERVDLPADVENTKIAAAFTYKSQLRNVELRDLILSSLRKNELLAVPSASVQTQK